MHFINKHHETSGKMKAGVLMETIIHKDELIYLIFKLMKHLAPNSKLLKYDLFIALSI